MALHAIELCAGVGMKNCNHCGILKEVGEFYPRGRGRVPYCKPCWNERNRAKSPEQRKARAEKDKRYRAALREQVIAAYGGKCECCEEHRPEFLALDHVHGGGTKERRSSAANTSAGMYRIARDEGFPDRFRILCHNCNCARGWYGVCPHETERSCG